MRKILSRFTVIQRLWHNASLRGLKIAAAGVVLLPWRALMALVMLGLFLLTPPWASGQQSPITLVSSNVINEFPKGFRIQVEAASDQPIETIIVQFRVGSRTIGSYNYLEFEKGTSIDGEYFHRTDTNDRYIPPGTMITYFFEIEDAAGQQLETEPQTFVYHDARFEWQEMSKEAVTISYYGPVGRRAEILLDATLETLNHMGPLLGVDITEPIRITMYNNTNDMLKGLPPRSTTIRRELITEGQAFTEEGLILTLGSGTSATGTVSHEVTHIVVRRATRDARQAIPVWLNEGLAEYGNIDPGFAYDRALEFAIFNNRLFPIIFLNSFPGTPEDIIIGYGAARSIVMFLIDSFGEDKMGELMATINDGRIIDDALIAVYGFDRLGLDAIWRDSIGAPPYVPSEEKALPTPVAYPTILPYSLTPQAGAEVFTTLTPGPEPPTPTPEPAPSPVPATPSPMPIPTQLLQATPTPAEALTGGGFTCGVPSLQRGASALDLSFVAVLVGLLGLRLRGRRR